MLKIEQATAEQIHDVALEMRARDFDEFRAANEADTREDMAALMVRKLGNREDILCASWRDEPICIGGFILIRPRVIALMLYATDEFPRIGLPLTRFIVRQMMPRLEKAGVHRFEAQSLAGYDQVHAWLKTLGLVQETGPLLNYGRNGEAFIQFAKVVHACPAGA